MKVTVRAFCYIESFDFETMPTPTHLKPFCMASNRKKFVIALPPLLAKICEEDRSENRSDHTQFVFPFAESQTLKLRIQKIESLNFKLQTGLSVKQTPGDQ